MLLSLHGGPFPTAPTGTEAALEPSLWDCLGPVAMEGVTRSSVVLLKPAVHVMDGWTDRWMDGWMSRRDTLTDGFC